jgi:hypothetical protein
MRVSNLVCLASQDAKPPEGQNQDPNVSGGARKRPRAAKAPADVSALSLMGECAGLALRLSKQQQLNSQRSHASPPSALHGKGQAQRPVKPQS